MRTAKTGDKPTVHMEGVIRAKPQDRGKPGVTAVQTENLCDTSVTKMVAVGELSRGLMQGPGTLVRSLHFILMVGHWGF